MFGCIPVVLAAGGAPADCVRAHGVSGAAQGGQGAALPVQQRPDAFEFLLRRRAQGPAMRRVNRRRLASALSAFVRNVVQADDCPLIFYGRAGILQPWNPLSQWTRPRWWTP